MARMVNRRGGKGKEVCLARRIVYKAAAFYFWFPLTLFMLPVFSLDFSWDTYQPVRIM